MRPVLHAALPVALLAGATLAAQPSLPRGYWAPAKAAAVLAQTAELRLAPDLSRLTDGERRAVDELIKAGRIVQDLYEDARHPQALAARVELERLDRRGGSQATRDLLRLYRLFSGPVGTTLESRREPFLPAESDMAGKNVYPASITRTEVDAFLAAHPDRKAALLDERTVVRRATDESIGRDRKAIDPALRVLHPGVARELDELARRPDPKWLYAVPQAVAWAEPLRRVYGHLLAAADAVEPDDAEFAGYLRNRARDLLTNDYESGDASWVTGRFRRLNAVIGSYETYDDALYGAKAFPEVSLLVTDEGATADLRARIRGIQAIEDALPYDAHRRVREDIPVGVYDIIADFGHARGTNTATILPNSAAFSRRYGRTILLRRNIMEHPDLFATTASRWRAVVAAAHAQDLKPAGQFQRTLWHEIGHYLGPDVDRRGRPLDAALEEHADALEEMKADLVSLFAHAAQARSGAVSAEALGAVQASGIMRTLQLTRPRPDQPYNTMQLAQFNYFLDRGLLEFDSAGGRLRIRYERYAEAVAALLREVLTLQRNGDKAAAAAFFAQWGAWTPGLHARLATEMRSVPGPRFRLVRYAALGE